MTETESINGGRADNRRRPRRSWLRRLLFRAAVVIVAAPVAITLACRVVDPPITPLMIIRLFEGEGLERQWVELADITPYLRHAVIAAEDNHFCGHNGFDWRALEDQVAALEAGRRPRGASTISMQTAKNLLLWPGRDYLRKALEVPLTALIEITWPKRRILEVYLNIAETGPGRYGAEAAARGYFNRAAADLTPAQAALIATTLPAPLARTPGRPSPSHRQTAGTIQRRIVNLGPAYFACVDDP